MKHAIIPDVHQDIEKLSHILRTIESMNVDRKVFLGDWFDTFDSLYNHDETSEYLSKLIENDPNCTFIFGNHDFPYAYNPKIFPCPGFEWNHSIDVKRYMQREHWNVFKLAHKVGKYWCSHAGIHSFLAHPIYGLTDEHIIHKCNEALLDAKNNNYNPWLGWGEDRGGNRQKYGGILWLDFNKSFIPIDGLNQIIGHSIAWKPRHIWTETSDNWCIDTRLDDFLIIDDETNEVRLFNTYGIEIAIDNPKHVAECKYTGERDKVSLIKSANDYRETAKSFL